MSLFDFWKKKKIEVHTIQELKDACEESGYGAIMIVEGNVEKVSPEIKIDLFGKERMALKIDGEWITIWNVSEDDQEAIFQMQSYDIRAEIKGGYNNGKLRFGTSAIALTLESVADKAFAEEDRQDLGKAEQRNDLQFERTRELFESCWNEGLRKIPDAVLESTSGISTAQKIATTLFIAHRQDKAVVPKQGRK